MTEDLIAMAHEAGFLYFNSGKFSEHGAIRRFAALIEARAVARTREECAALCDNLTAPPSCYRIERSLWDVATVACADAIRAMGERT